MRQTRFLQAVKPNSQITSNEYAKKMKVSISTALRDLKDLHCKGCVKKFGKCKNVYYYPDC